MARPSEFVLASEIGQRFALNFYHCWTENMFEDPVAVEQFLKSWWEECLRLAKTSDSDQALNLLASRMKGLSGKFANIRRMELSRVVSFTAFYSPPTSARSTDYSFFKTKYVTDTYGINLKTSLTGDIFKKFERINSDANAVRPGA